MTLIETIAVILAIIILVKFVLMMFLKPKLWQNMAKGFLKHNNILTAVYLVLFLALGYLLLQELNIVQLFIGALFGTGLYVLLLLPYPKVMNVMIKEITENKTKSLLCWLVFIVMSVWVLIYVFV